MLRLLQPRSNSIFAWFSEEVVVVLLLFLFLLLLLFFLFVLSDSFCLMYLLHEQDKD